MDEHSRKRGGNFAFIAISLIVDLTVLGIWSAL